MRIQPTSSPSDLGDLEHLKSVLAGHDLVRDLLAFREAGQAGAETAETAHVQLDRDAGAGRAFFMLSPSMITTGIIKHRKQSETVKKSARRVALNFSMD